jgi:hypothetical protein
MKKGQVKGSKTGEKESRRTEEIWKQGDRRNSETEGQERERQREKRDRDEEDSVKNFNLV